MNNQNLIYRAPRFIRIDTKQIYYVTCGTGFGDDKIILGPFDNRIAAVKARNKFIRDQRTAWRQTSQDKAPPFYCKPLSKA
jgi:hypothetical protein